jgi:hypothetical protein
MKINYKGFEIDVHKGKSMADIDLTFYSVFANNLEITSGYSYDDSPVREQIKWYKQYVDALIKDPSDYIEPDDIEFLRKSGLLPVSQVSA